jgi:hypothetical protein
VINGNQWLFFKVFLTLCWGCTVLGFCCVRVRELRILVTCISAYLQKAGQPPMPTQTFIFFSRTLSGFQTPICGLLIFPLVSVAVRRRHLLKTLINKAETSSSPRSPHIHNPRPPIISEVFFSLPSTGHQQICIDLSASDL